MASKTSELKKIQEQKREIRKKEKELKAALDASKENRKKARLKVAKAKVAALDSRKKMSDAMKELNGIMLTKSIKNNLDEFKKICGTFYAAASDMIENNDTLIEAMEELKKHE